MYLQILILLGLIGIIGECYFISLWIIGKRNKVKEVFKKYTPSAFVIIPCKGLEPGVVENIGAFCSQEYPKYKLLFVVDSDKDPIYKHIKKLNEIHDHVSIKISKILNECSGKISALLTGLESIKSEEIIVFADSDIKPKKTWLKNLIEPLQDKSNGACTGYRWYFSTDFKSKLISTWNLASIAFLFQPTYNFTWGGSTAIKKSIFDKLEIKNKWKTAFSDDLILTNTLKNAGYKIYFQPKCVMESVPEKNLKRFKKWGTRQYTWLRWYYPIIFYSSFIGLAGVKILTIFGFILLFFGLYVPAFLMISVIAFEMIFGWQGIVTLQKTMVYPKESFPSKFSYAIIMPLVFFMIVQNMIASLFQKEIIWAGRSYKKRKNII